MTQQLPPDPQRPTRALPAPTLEESPDAIPAFAGDFGAPDVQYVLDVMNQCVAARFAQGGDTRYVVQHAFSTAREALGVLVAMGLIESTTRLAKTQEPLWKSPAVPPMGASARPTAANQI